MYIHTYIFLYFVFFYNINISYLEQGVYSLQIEFKQSDQRRALDNHVIGKHAQEIISTNRSAAGRHKTALYGPISLNQPRVLLQTRQNLQTMEDNCVYIYYIYIYIIYIWIDRLIDR